MKNQSKIRAAIAAVAFLGLSTTVAVCQEDSYEVQAEEFIQSLDKNSDQKIDKQEAEASKAIFESFDNIDKDGDGLIDKKELAAFLKGEE